MGFYSDYDDLARFVRSILNSPDVATPDNLGYWLYIARGLQGYDIMDDVLMHGKPQIKSLLGGYMRNDNYFCYDSELTEQPFYNEFIEHIDKTYGADVVKQAESLFWYTNAIKDKILRAWQIVSEQSEEPGEDTQITELPPELDTERARKCFARAIKLGYMERTDTGYKWLFGDNFGSCGKVRGRATQKSPCSDTGRMRCPLRP